MPLKREKEIKLPDLRMKKGIKEMYMFEIGDMFFHHDSAVTLPSDSKREEEKSMEVIANMFKYMDENIDKRFVITGHTDTTGSPKYNFWLSVLRGNNVFFLLDGERDKWMAWCNSKHKVEDYQHILRHYVNLWGWDCDPGEIDNILGPKTKEAIRKFQEKYNEEFQKNIKVDGIVGEETWGAFYDCYINEVADIMGTDVNEIREKYQKNVLDKRATIPSTHPCGESYPIEEPNRDNYRSQTNRRVEVLFFNENEAPKKCYNIPEKVSSDPTASPFKDKPCNIEEECPIYKKGLYKLKKVKK